MALTLEQARQNALNKRNNIMQQTIQQNAVSEESKPENTGGLLGGIGYTLGRVGLGALRGLEGIWDFAAGGIADLFGADEWAYEQATESPFDDLTTELDAWYNPSEFMQFVGDVGAGVGQMLPSVAAAAIPGVGPALSTAMFTTSAAGMGVSDAAKTTGELGAKEWLYGTASGALEGAIEKVSGGIGKFADGTFLGKQIAKSTAGKVAASFFGEGLEEVVSDLIDPSLRRVTGVDPEATVDVKQLPNTFLVGGAAGAILSGGQRAVNAARVGGFNNLNASEDLAAIREAQSRGNTLQNEGKLNAKWESTLSSKQTEAEQRLSSRLQKMDAETRGKFISDNNLGSVFDADGNIRTAAEGYTAPAYNADAVSFSAREDVNKGTLQYAPTQSAVREDIKSAISDVIKTSEGNGKFVVVDTLTNDAGQKVNGQYDRSTGITYIANDGDVNGVKSYVAAHEYTHQLEGSKQYVKYSKEIRDFLESLPKNDPLRKKYDFQKKFDDYKKAHPDFKNETVAYITDSEIVADFTAQEIFSNEDAVRRLANRNKNLVVRIYEWVKDKINGLRKEKGNAQNLAFFRKAEKLLARALNVPTGGVDLNKIDEEVRKEKEESAQSATAENRLAGVRMSIQNVDGKQIVVIDTDQDIFDGAERSEYGKIVRDYMREHFRGQTINGIKFNSRSEKEYTMSGDSQGAYRQNGGRYETKMRAGTELANLVKTGTFISHEAAKHPHTYNAGGYNRYSVEFILDDVPFSGEMLVALNGEYGAFYDIVKIKRNGSTIRDVPKSVERVSMEDSSSTNSIRDNAENVNTNEQNSRENIRYSISENQNTRDENYVNNKLKTYTYADVESIVDNLAINKYGDDVVLRDKKNVGKQKQK